MTYNKQCYDLKQAILYPITSNLMTYNKQCYDLKQAILYPITRILTMPGFTS